MFKNNRLIILECYIKRVLAMNVSPAKDKLMKRISMATLRSSLCFLLFTSPNHCSLLHLVMTKTFSTPASSKMSSLLRGSCRLTPMARVISLSSLLPVVFHLISCRYNYVRFWLLLVKIAAILDFGHVNIVGHYYKRFH